MTARQIIDKLQELINEGWDENSEVMIRNLLSGNFSHAYIDKIEKGGLGRKIFISTKLGTQ